MKLLALLAQLVVAQMWPNPGPGHAPYAASGGGTDFSANAACIGYWDFEGVGATSLADKCASGTAQNMAVGGGTPNPGITSASPCTTGGSAGSQCYVNDGVDGALSTADDAIWNAAPITFGCMGLKTTDANTSGFLGHLDFNGSTGGQGFWLGFTSAEALFGRVSDGSATHGGTSELSTWYSVITRWDPTQNGGAVQLFRDGTQIAQSVSETAIEDSFNSMKIGLHSEGGGPDGYLAGAVDDCFVYGGYLNDAEICAIANFGFKGDDADRSNGC